MVTIFRLLVISCACLLGWSQATALCAGGGIQNLPRYVGNTVKSSPTYDSKCTDNDIQSAINNTVCPNTPIYITGEHTYTQEALSIQGKWLSLVGSTNACGVPAGTYTSPAITISGKSGASVISISGTSTVTLRYLTISDGNPGQSQSGGGIYFTGTGSLTLDTDTISDNQAGYGGGIDMSPTGNATLTLLKNTLVIENTAGISGGGIRIEGQTRLFMLDDESSVSFNDAQFGYGGGIEIIGPARADIGSSGDVFVGAVSDNKAVYGGGMAIIGVSAGNAVARLFSTNATTPVDISSNSATGQGGGIYLQGDTSDQTGAFLCGHDFRIDLNTSPDGAAIFAADTDTDPDSKWYGTGVELNTSGQCGPEAESTLGAVACAANTPCNEISGNAAQNADGSQSDGSVISMRVFSYLKANRFAMRQNSGAQIVNLLNGFANETGSIDYMQNCLIVDNQSAHEIIHSDQHFGSFTLDNCTIANNTIDNGYVIFAQTGLNLSNDLFAQPNNSTLDYQQGDTSLNDDCATYAFCLFSQYIIATETASLLGPDFSLQSGTPLFVDATNGDISKRDYHLQAFVIDGVVTASPAMDFAPAISGAGNDLDNNPRDQDVPLIPNRFGMSDLGAYEMQPIGDRIFADAFGDATSLVY